MTDPKQTAKEIVDKYKPHVTTWDCYWDTEMPDEQITKDAKKCAIIHVNGIISVLENLCKPEYTSFFHGEMGSGTTMDGYELKDFFNDVLNEINKL